MRQLGHAMSCLAELSFEEIGSLFEDGDGSYVVGECPNPSLLWQHWDELESLGHGPFAEEDQYLQCLIHAFEVHAKELPLYTHSFFAPIPGPFGLIHKGPAE